MLVSKNAFLAKGDDVVREMSDKVLPCASAWGGSMAVIRDFAEALGMHHHILVVYHGPDGTKEFEIVQLYVQLSGSLESRVVGASFRKMLSPRASGIIWQYYPTPIASVYPARIQKCFLPERGEVTYLSVMYSPDLARAMKMAAEEEEEEKST